MVVEQQRLMMHTTVDIIMCSQNRIKDDYGIYTEDFICHDSNDVDDNDDDKITMS